MVNLGRRRQHSEDALVWMMSLSLLLLLSLLLFHITIYTKIREEELDFLARIVV